MVAVLESVPEFADSFLPRAFPRLHMIKILGQIIKAGTQACIGFVLIGLYRPKGQENP